MLYVIRAVREREQYVQEALKQIPDAVVYYDDKYHDAMRSYLHVCRDIVGDQPAVLLEDDIILTSNFREKCESVINRYPEILINFFSLSKKHAAPYFNKGRQYCMNQCEYFPRGFGSKVARSYESWPLRDSEPNAYDYLVRYAWGYNKLYLVWVPSLVQHRSVKSVIDPKRSSKRQSITFQE